MDIICHQLNDINITTNNLEAILNYETLELLSELEPDQVFSLVISNNNFKYTLNNCVDVNMQMQLMNIFSKLKFLKLNQAKTIILDMIDNSSYLERFYCSLRDFIKAGGLISKTRLLEFFTNCNSLLEIMTNPNSTTLLNEIIQFIKSNSMDFKQLELTNDNLKTEQMLQVFKNLKATNCIKYKVKRWPEYYKNLSIYPTTTDITSKIVILSTNIINGIYENVEHYLDVQFRLLREDIIAPIREGIQFYTTMYKLNHDVLSMPNMHIYFRAKIEKKVKNQKSLYIVNFYTEKNCSVDSKRFMFESLLVFSDDYFNSMFFAKVIKIKRDALFKTLVIEPLGNETIKLNSLYTMAESDAYFLPYMYSMKVLKTFNICNFPMKSYIVYGNTKPKVPAYLTYNSKMYNINGLQFDILNDKCWPDNTFLGLDNAQSMAFKAALTEEFTVIQGPPGTGKTYIGLRIARSIIENMYETNILRSPIVVICYTNHALDQFLVGLLNITKKIVRIGGGCKSDILKANVVGNIQSPSAKQHIMHSHVVGLTTTGASMRYSLLVNIKPPIVIVEEAAEVLESYVVTSLTKFCQHVILIGDHKQLRPRTASFTLSKQFDFDVSLFERMVQNGFPYHTLVTQYRMCPEISALMKPIYPNLKNHESVINRGDIRGVTKNVYFIHHEMQEEKVIGSNSYKNIHEVKFFMEFARYLFNQGYRQDQITILVTYQAQLLELQKIRDTSCVLEDFRIECVDGYQGEENDIILLSLVRSNIDNNIGFLNIQNRICVALSRAKNGLYIMGNMDNLIHSTVWKEMSQILINQKCLGNKLTLCCEIHKDWTSTVCDSSDFSKNQCSKICNIKMDCGHLCPHFCHYYDQSHKTLYRCTKYYIRTLACGFKINIECWMRFLIFNCPK
ncbi:P-loop containing nucleoside triphosphate hydrolase [Cinara cedri]|uniref:P-loop containing nucleoside triphosphate hydrolase n=1 Tax=Cinara cedri TaxID=506608 RepID=A0A5E4NKJ9_9HEMI|nr:P-loop containing nucleoside triphosphate hydrolase [Cinara cedri]